jgi:hypothetical protein
MRRPTILGLGMPLDFQGGMPTMHLRPGRDLLDRGLPTAHLKPQPLPAGSPTDTSSPAAQPNPTSATPKK